MAASAAPPASSSWPASAAARTRPRASPGRGRSQRVGRLEAEQAAADHDAARCAVRVLADRLEVLDGAVDEAAVQLDARHRRHERCRRRWRAPARRTPGRLAVGKRDPPRVGVESTPPRCRAPAAPRVVVGPRAAATAPRRSRRRRTDVSATRSYAGRGSSPTTTTSYVSVSPRSMAACTKRWPTMPWPTTTRVCEGASWESSWATFKVRRPCVEGCFAVLQRGKPALSHGRRRAPTPVGVRRRTRRSR